MTTTTTTTLRACLGTIDHRDYEDRECYDEDPAEDLPEVLREILDEPAKILLTVTCADADNEVAMSTGLVRLADGRLLVRTMYEPGETGLDWGPDSLLDRASNVLSDLRPVCGSCANHWLTVRQGGRDLLQYGLLAEDHDGGYALCEDCQEDDVEVLTEEITAEISAVIEEISAAA